MSQQDKLSGEPSARFDPQTLLALPIGLSTPFFLAFYSVASVGAAFWWMSRLTGYTHLEAQMAKAADAPEPASEVVSMTEPELSVEEPVAVIAAEPEAVAAKPKPAAKRRIRKSTAPV